MNLATILYIFFYNTMYANINKLQYYIMFLTRTCVHDSIAILVLTDVIILYLIIIIILMYNYIYIELFSKVNFFGPVYICSNKSVHLYDYVHEWPQEFFQGRGANLWGGGGEAHIFFR